MLRLPTTKRSYKDNKRREPENGKIFEVHLVESRKALGLFLSKIRRWKITFLLHAQAGMMLTHSNTIFDSFSTYVMEGNVCI